MQFSTSKHLPMIITESTDVQISPTSPIMLLFSILFSGPGSNPEQCIAFISSVSLESFSVK